MRVFEKIEDLLEHCGFYGPIVVADFGCGAGHFAMPIAQRISSSGKVYALDIQEPPLSVLRKEAKRAHLYNVHTMRADIERALGSRLKDESVDKVVVANMLFQTPEKKNVLLEANRILKKRGKLITVEWHTRHELPGPRRELRVSPDTLKGLLTNANLPPIHAFELGSFHYGFISEKS
ncbi:MAG: class I SAM-dependent methyltransferase [Candidatus Ryanbacteria bacterium]|nr:class I SAM-dependent methyltransferase [Candidatus Ryanbacteria bacterium]